MRTRFTRSPLRRRSLWRFCRSSAISLVAALLIVAPVAAQQTGPGVLPGYRAPGTVGTIAQNEITSDAQAISTTATWNNAGTTFTHWKANVTDTASASASLLLDLQVGGSSKFNVTKAGQATAIGGVWSQTTLFLGKSGSNSLGSVTADSDGVFSLKNAAGTDFSRLNFGGTTSSFPALKRNGTGIDVKLADDSGYAPFTVGTLTASTTVNANVKYGIGASATTLISATAPTISSGFGTSPSIATNNGTASFTVNVGTGGSATSGVIGLPTATTGWNCFVSDQTTNVSTRQTASTTTSATITAASAWTASDTLLVSCFAR